MKKELLEIIKELETSEALNNQLAYAAYETYLNKFFLQSNNSSVKRNF